MLPGKRLAETERIKTELAASGRNCEQLRLFSAFHSEGK